VIEGQELEKLVKLSRDGTTTIIMDEFYSWYMYPENEEDFGRCVSSASYVEDVDDDAVVIIDGLTKVGGGDLEKDVG
jgi:aspartate/methionine/tyrosine aminotransferase